MGTHVSTGPIHGCRGGLTGVDFDSLSRKRVVSLNFIFEFCRKSKNVVITEIQDRSEPDPRRVLPLAMVERAHIERVMAHPAVNGRRDLAADLLGIGRTTLFRKLKRYREQPKQA